MKNPAARISRGRDFFSRHNNQFFGK